MRRLLWLLLPITFVVMCAGWALTSPPGSSPDDDYHLTSIWCSSGISPGRCEEVPGQPSERAVPARVVNAATCFAFHPEVSAGCTQEIAPGMVTTDRVNETAGLYPSLYYRVMGVFVGPDVERSVLAMRLANAALAGLLLALLLRVVPVGLSRAALLGIVVTFIPMGLFLVASTNPSGWSIVGLALYLAFATALLHRSDWRNRRTWLITGGLFATAVMALGSRVDAAAYLVLASALAAILTGPPRLRRALPSTVIVGLVALAGLVTYATHGTPSMADEAAAAGQAQHGLGLLVTNATYLPILLQQAVGLGGLGWNDTALPPLVGVMGALAVGAIAYAGLSSMTARKAVAAGVALLALVAVPLAFLQKEGLAVGELVQPRYLLPLLALLLIVLCIGPRPGQPLALARTPSIAIAVGLSVSSIVAFWANAHRYLAGSTVGLFDASVDPQWTSSSGMPLGLTVAVTVLASVAFVTGAFSFGSRPQA